MQRAAQKLYGAPAVCLCALAWVLALGCMSPVLKYEGMHTSCHVDNIDGDNNWDSGDTNGNGQIDSHENYAPQVDFDEVRRSETGLSRVTTPPSPTPTRNTAASTINRIRLVPFSMGFADDIDRDGHYGTTASNLPTIIGVESVPTDFDDLVRLPTRFATSAHRNYSTFRGFSLAKVFRYTISADSGGEKDKAPPEMPLEVDPNSNKDAIALSVGGRFSRFEDLHSTDLRGGLMGSFNTSNIVDQTTIGPEVGIEWRGKRLDWLLSASGSFLIGYLVEDLGQTGMTREELIPSQANHPLYFQSTQFTNNVANDELTPQANLNLSASYPLSKSTSVSLGYRLLYIEDLQYAQQFVNWTIPSLGIIEQPRERLTRGTLYASFDLRR